MMNMKNGKIRSVGVRPNHSACCRGAYVASSGPPGLFTKIMPAMVIPRRMSIDVIRCFLGFVSFVSGLKCLYYCLLILTFVLFQVCIIRIQFMLLLRV